MEFLTDLISVFFYKKENNTVFVLRFLTKTKKKVSWIGTYKPESKGRGANFFLKRGLAVFGFSGSISNLLKLTTQEKRKKLFNIPHNIPFRIEEYNKRLYISISNEFK